MSGLPNLAVHKQKMLDSIERKEAGDQAMKDRAGQFRLEPGSAPKGSLANYAQ